MRGLLGDVITLEVNAAEPTVARLDLMGFEPILLDLAVSARDATDDTGGGRIDVESRVGEGTLTAVWPLLEEPAQEQLVPPPPSEAP